MDQDARPIPAWKRLGLKLRSGDQSGGAVHEINGIQTIDSCSVDVSDWLNGKRQAIHHVRPTENGKPSKLGKRQRQDEAAERHVQKQMKKKRIRSNEHEKPTGDTLGSTATNESANTEPKPEFSASTVSQKAQLLPAGDPNYRKKKIQPEQSASFKRSTLKPPENGTNVRTDAQQQARKQILSPGEGGVVEDRSTLLESTETENLPPPSLKTLRSSKKSTTFVESQFKQTSVDSSSSELDRRKSVTFTPDTKTVDGSSALNLFKKWVADQKGADGSEFSPAEVAQFAPPPKSHPANDVQSPQSAGLKEKSTGDQKKNKDKKRQKTQADSEANAKKDHSLYLSYLSQFHNDRENWKFNKAKQNDLLHYAQNIFRIPDKYADALLEYVKGLKGAAIIERLKIVWEDVVKQLDKEERAANSNMNDSDALEAAKQEALEERLAKEKKRRRTDGDVEDLKDHPCPEGFIRRLKRRRAEALLSALNIAVPIAPMSSISSDAKFERTAPGLNESPAISRNSRKRKLRTEVSSDESSSAESSSEESSSLEDSSSAESEDESDSESVSESGSGSGTSDSENADNQLAEGHDNEDNTEDDASTNEGSSTENDSGSGNGIEGSSSESE